MKRSFSSVLIGILLLASCPNGAAWAYNSLYVFGDSLSDQGNIYEMTWGLYPSSEYSDGTTYGRFTNGRNYVDYLAPMLGLTSSNSLSQGNNYAYGGARTDSHPVSWFGALSLLDQLAAFNQTHSAGADPNALFIVWAGGNNLSDILSLTDPEISSPLTKTAWDLGVAVATLASDGARNILVPNLPDMGIVPSVTGGGASNERATLVTNYFNSMLDAFLGGIEQNYPGINLMRFDIFTLVDDVYHHPGPYGFTNVTDACLSEGAVTGNPADYLFWDGLHPTSAGHQLLAERMYSTVVPIPGSILLFCSSLATGFLLRWRNRARQ